MSRVLPVYHDQDASYRADSCEPLTAAAAAGKIRFSGAGHGHYPGTGLPKGCLPGLKMVGSWDAGPNQTWGLGWHFNEGLEIAFLESGSLPFSVDSVDCMLQPGDLTITRPWQRHRLGDPHIRASKLCWLIIDLGIRRPNDDWSWPSWIVMSSGDLEELTTHLRLNEQPSWKSTPDLCRCFRAISHSVDFEKCKVSSLAVRVNELLLLLLELIRQNKPRLDRSLSTTRRTVELFLEDLRTHPEHLEIAWDLKRMASQCGLAPTQFTSHVRKLTNLSPNEFLNRCRLDHAAELLRRNKGSITDVALQVGFSSTQYFATVFKRYMGVQPSSLRR